MTWDGLLGKDMPRTFGRDRFQVQEQIVPDQVERHRQNGRGNAIQVGPDDSAAPPVAELLRRTGTLWPGVVLHMTSNLSSSIGLFIVVPALGS